jgi:hypothetical protein
MKNEAKNLIDKVWAMKTPGLPRAEAARAAYDVCVAKYGFEAVGGFEQYLPVKPAGYWTLERCKASALQFQSKSQWDKHARGAFEAARARGWLGICCAHMPEYVQSAKWTLERMRPIAAAYRSRTHFEKERPYLKRVCDEKGFTEQLFPRLGPDTGNVLKWTLEACKAEALKYQTLSQWEEGHRQSHKVATKKGWREQCCAHMSKVMVKPGDLWTLERCQESALRFQTRTDWSKGERAAYMAALKNGWVDECCAHMPVIRKAWTLAECKASALQYQTREAWEKGDRKPSRYAAKHGWMNECCAHMATPFTWTFEMCRAESQKHTRKIDWLQASGGSYVVAKNKGWMDELSAHMVGKQEQLPFGYWTKERVLEAARKYKTPADWMRGCAGSRKAAQRNGWIKEACAHMKVKVKESLPRGTWESKERALKEAAKYKTIKEFVKAAPGAYTSARRLGWWKECIEAIGHTRKCDYTFEQCVDVAKRFSTRSEFRRSESAVVLRAERKGWYEQCCAHMNTKQTKGVE